MRATNIFNAIKYPLSYPPTEQQLSDLPPDLLDKWSHAAGFDGNWTPSNLSMWFNQYHDSEDEDKFESDTPEIGSVVADRDFKALKKMILEYKE